MDYQTIVTMPVASLTHLTYQQFVELFITCNKEIERLEELQDRENWKDLYLDRARLISRLERTRETLTMHKHYDDYCAAMDKKHWDAVYHRPLQSAAA